MSSNSTYYGPVDEEPALIAGDRGLIIGLYLGGLAIGVHACVFAATVYYLLLPSARGRMTRFNLGFVTILFALSAVLGGLGCYTVQLIYVDGRNYPGGPLAWWGSIGVYSGQYMVQNVVGTVTNAMADGLLIYRVWMLWNQNLLVLFLSGLIWLAGTACAFATVWGNQLLPDDSRWEIDTILLITKFMLTSGLTIILTLLILFRMLTHARRVKLVLGADHAKRYTSIAATVFESAVLLSIMTVIDLAMTWTNSPYINIISIPLGQVVGIAPELIILRVAMGRAWSQDLVSKVTTIGRDTAMVECTRAPGDLMRQKTVDEEARGDAKIEELERSHGDGNSR